MIVNPGKFAEEVSHQLRAFLDAMNQDVFRPAIVLGGEIPLCPVMVGDVPDEDYPTIGTIYSYFSESFELLLHGFQWQNAFFIWTSPIAALASRTKLMAQKELRRRLTILAMIAMRSRVRAYAQCFPEFRHYTIDDLAPEDRGSIFQNGFLKESIHAREHECVDDLILFQLLNRLLANAKYFDDFARGYPLLVNR